MSNEAGDVFRQALRQWASGVTVVTASVEGTPHGMTVSAFSSVSAEPPLILVCANRDSTTNGIIRDCGAFAVNILESAQGNVSTRFATASAEERFAATPWKAGENGMPLIEGALAHLECDVHSAHEEGTHTIYIGAVKRCEVFAGSPLCYFDGGYAAIERV